MHNLVAEYLAKGCPWNLQFISVFDGNFKLVKSEEGVRALAGETLRDYVSFITGHDVFDLETTDFGFMNHFACITINRVIASYTFEGSQIKHELWLKDTSIVQAGKRYSQILYLSYLEQEYQGNLNNTFVLMTGTTLSPFNFDL